MIIVRYAKNNYDAVHGGDRWTQEDKYKTFKSKIQAYEFMEKKREADYEVELIKEAK